MRIQSDFIDPLVPMLGSENVLRTPEDLAAYSFDGTFVEGTPAAVVLPRTTDQVRDVVRHAAHNRVPIVPRGMGTGLAAGSISIPEGCLVVCLTRMARVLEIDRANATARVEAGVVTADLQSRVEEVGLSYPPDPSSNRHSTIGGNIACNAGGPHCLKYGVTGDYVLGLTVVLADGGILRTGGKSIKDVTGLDLNALFTGSEGTLGLVTEALLRLVPKPRFARTALAEFDLLEAASLSVTAILDAAIVPAAIELMDQTAIACVEEAFHLGLATDAEAMLIIETDGADEDAVAREINAASRICIDHHARSVHVARDELERTSLWEARRALAPALARKAPNKLGEDITVPRSAIPEVVHRLRAISTRNGLPIVIFGHAGDGNMHPNILFDRRHPKELETAERMVSEIFEASLALGGSLSGEHGVGLLKKPYLERALGPVSMDVQRRIKRALDPSGLLNPGKIF